MGLMTDMSRDWAAERQWIQQIIDQRVGTATRKWVEDYMTALADGIADVEHKIVQKEREAMRREIEERVAKSDAAAVDLILELQRKIVDLERRAVLKPTRPQLVAGDPDA